MLRRGVLALALAGLAPLAWAQGAVNDGPATFELATGHFDTTPSANFTGVSTPLAQDHVFEEGWWYRVQGDPAEKFFPVPDAQDYSGAVATLTWNDVDGRGFSAQEVLSVHDSMGPSGCVESVLTLTNNNPGALPIDVFHALDMDLAGTSGGDVGTLLGPADIGIADGAQTGEYRGLGAGAFLVRPFDAGGATDVPGLLSDAGVNDFDDTGLPFAAGDITLGFQWTTVSIPSGGQQTYHVVMAVNTPAVPVELMELRVE